MIYPSGYDSIDGQIKLDGRLIGGLPSGHVVAILENPEEQRDWPEHFISSMAQQADGTVWWADLVNQYPSGSALDNVLLTQWHRNDEWDQLVNLFSTIFEYAKPELAVIDNAFAFSGVRIGEDNGLWSVLSAFQQQCAVHDTLGFFLTYESAANRWAGDWAVRNHCSYVIDWETKKVVYSTVMGVTK